ncbi:MAG: SdrD B-like domain-containing protein [Saprospiraceae bacterium]
MKFHLLSLRFIFTFNLVVLLNTGIFATAVPPNASELLVDIRTTNTSPSVNDVFTYKIRYRYASTTEHGTNAQIQLTFPDAYNMISIPQTGGNISNVNDNGNQYTISLESPSSLGLPSGTLAAGSSGIFEFKVKFICGTNGSGGIPSAGSTTNLTQNPIFTVTGVSNTAAAPNAVTVPTVNACSPPPQNSNAGINKQAVRSVIGQGMYMYWNMNIPSTTSAVTFTDIFPTGMKLYDGIYSSSNFPSGWTIEVEANGSWWNITSFGKVRTWIASASNGGQLNDQNSTPITGVTRVDVDYPYSTPDISYADNVTGIRFTSPSGGDNAKNFKTYTYIPIDMPIGWHQNCLTSSAAGATASCKDIYVTDRGALILGCYFVYGSEALGGTDLNTANNNYIPNNYPNLYKDPLDLQGVLNISHHVKTGSVEDLTTQVLLPEGFDFIENTATPNYWVIQEEELSAFNSQTALTPVFTRTPNYNGTGRTLIKWEFPNLIFPQWSPFSINNDLVKLRVYFSTRYMGTAALPNSGNITAYGEIFTGTVMTYPNGGSSYAGTPTQNLGCTIYSGYPPSHSGAVNSEKYVQGALDVQQSRYPISGNTNLAGDAVYEMYIYNHNFEPLKQIDIVDILPYIGDKEMLGSNSRGSDWSEEIASNITVERYKIGQGEVSALSYIPNGILYSNTYNACYLDAALPTGQATADPALASVGQSAGCTDFGSSAVATGSKGFAFRWTQPGDPLQFGEYLKVTVPVQQLNGEADMTNNEVAWNSFAYTVVEDDDDVLFSSEPLKVGVKMVDLASKANICGVVWKDDNANGRRDAGEILVNGITVSLYDASGNPVTESVTINGVTSNVPVTVTTDNQGAYCFYGLTPSTNYYTRLENENNFTLSGSLASLELTIQNASGVDDAEDSDANEGTLSGSPATARPQIGITTGVAGTTSYNNDFGFYGFGSIGNYVWNDDDADGAQDGDETPVQGVVMSLYKVGGFFVASQTTDINGRYLFDQLIPGNYYVVASSLPAGKIPTVKNATGNNNNDSDFGANLQTDNFSLSSGEAIGYIDLGLKPQVANPASICGHTWDDYNENGVINSGEEPMINVTVQLLDASGFVLTTTTTDNNGDYCFNNLTPNTTYQIGFVLPSPTGSSFTNAGADMDANTSTGITGTYTPTTNQNITDVDAGFIGPFSIGNLVWSDLNDNGVKDNNEAAYSNVKVYLFNSAGTIYLDSTTTDNYGKYVFTNLTQGSYKVGIQVQNDTRSSTDLGSTPTPNSQDDDDNGIGVVASGIVMSNTITLQQGGGSSGSNWFENDHGEVINGQLDPASNRKAYYTVDFGLKTVVPEVCDNGTDDDGDNLTDCLDGDCQYITFDNITVGNCIDHPYADVASLDVTISWTSSAPATTITVSIDGQNRYIDIAGGATSPQTVTFQIPADGSTNNNITAVFENEPCSNTTTYDAPNACSNDQLGCSILYLCGDSKGSDADAFDHGLMTYLDGINGNSILIGALTKNVGGQGLYDPNNTSTLTPYDIDTFDIVLVSATTWGYVSSTLKTQLKETEANVLLLSQDLLVDMAMASYKGYLVQTYAYTDNTTQVQIYDFNNTNPRWDELIGKGDYHTNTADAYLWGITNGLSSGLKGVFFHYNATDVLGGVPSTHGARTFLGYMMDGVYWNNDTNMGATPVPQADWFDPIRHLTQEGKLYLDQAIEKAAVGCAIEDCINGIDDDGDGLIDCDDSDCQVDTPGNISGN